jgi:four helix bundle protein
MRDFQELLVWQKGHKLALAIYSETADFPDNERFGMTSQMRRAASSIPTNIAEGCGRNSDIEMARFMEIAMGSASELQYLLLLARDLTYLSEERYIYLYDNAIEIKRMLAPFIIHLRKKT